VVVVKAMVAGSVVEAEWVAEAVAVAEAVTAVTAVVTAAVVVYLFGIWHQLKPRKVPRIHFPSSDRNF
jgi:hypothetical protein